MSEREELLSSADVLALWETSLTTGLRSEQVGERLHQFGDNVLDEAGTRAPWWVVLQQFAGAHVGFLVGAVAVFAVLGALMQATLVWAMLVFGGIVAAVPSMAWERAVRAWVRTLEPDVWVLRDGQLGWLAGWALVPGDIIYLSPNEVVPADVRVLQAEHLEIARPDWMKRLPQPRPPDGSLPLWRGTHILGGTGLAVVEATGAATRAAGQPRLPVLTTSAPIERAGTRLMRIAAGLGVAVALAVAVALSLWERPIPMVALGVVAAGIPASSFGMSVYRDLSRVDVLRAWRALGVTPRHWRVVPELAAVSRMLVGQTGALTASTMTVREVWVPTGPVTLREDGAIVDGASDDEGASTDVDVETRGDLRALWLAAVRCNDAMLRQEGDARRGIGRAREVALLHAASAFGVVRPGRGRELARMPFTPARRRMTVVLPSVKGPVAYVKGAVEDVLPRCGYERVGDVSQVLDQVGRDNIEEAVRQMIARGLRPLAVASRVVPDAARLEADVVEADLVFHGVVGLASPALPGVSRKVAVARDGGVTLCVATGDAPGTPSALAPAVGLHLPRDFHGRAVAAADEATRRSWLRQPVAFTRCLPEHDAALVGALQSAGHTVLATGRRVEDAATLHAADVGVALEEAGAQGLSDGADIVVSEGGVARLLDAVVHARRYRRNLHAFALYAATSSVAEALVILGSAVAFGEVLLQPATLLGLVLMTRFLGALALAREPHQGALWADRADAYRGVLLARSNLRGVVVNAAAAALIVLGLSRAVEGAGAQSALVFAGLGIFEMAWLLAHRSRIIPWTTLGLWTNRTMGVAVLVVLVVLVAGVYLPPLQWLLGLAPLRPMQWLPLVTLAAPMVLLPELVKVRAWQDAHEGRRAR